MKRLFIAAVIAAVSIFGIWSIVISEDLLASLIEDSLRGSGMGADIAGLKKGLFYNFSSARLTLKKSGNPVISVDNIAGRVNPLSLLLRRLTLRFNGEAGGGGINGSFDLLGGKGLLYVAIEGAEMEGIPFFPLIGLRGRGVISGAVTMENGAGEAKFTVKDTVLESGSFGGITLPLNMFNNARGAMTFKPGMIRVVSFSLDGRDIYARLKGDIKGSSMDLTMELMPDKAYIEKNPLFLMLENYRVSPGYYSIPLTGKLPL